MAYKIKERLNKKLFIIAGVVILLIIGILVYRSQRNDDSLIIPTEEPGVATEEPVTTTNPESSTSDDAKTPSATPGTTSSGAGPSKPYGTFVSNHHPSLSGKNGVPSSLESVCQGTPGATCQIVFTQGSKTKSLPEKTIGTDSSVSWDWDVKKAGFTTGSWQIKAISMRNNKTAEATDSLAFEVMP